MSETPVARGLDALDEIERIAKAYEALSELDSATQSRALDWLTSRLAYDRRRKEPA